MNPGSTLYVLVGMICSGKSTYARQRANPADGSPGALVVCHDDLTQGLHGGVYRYEQGLRECYRGMEEDLAIRVMMAGRDVIIDRTHLTRESRQRWIRFAKSSSRALERCSIIAVAFPICSPMTHAKRRFAVDPRGRPFEEWLQVARQHFDQTLTEPLTEDEGFDRIEKM
jgi:predicted kinase